MDNIRNFSIIAHIDHGKSTLSDRLIEKCGGLSEREIETNQQILDSMDLERERGITIKARSVTLNYKALNGKNYQLNFIDTPGHVDFSYEVSRSLAACEGALLLVDAVQGVEAQTLANFNTAIEIGLKVVPILNKIDLPIATPKRVIQEIEDIIGIDATDSVWCSAKKGIGTSEILERIVRDIPPPEGNPYAALQAIIIDSWFDNYLGVVSLIRIKNGILRKGDKIKVMSTGYSYNVTNIGIFTPNRVNREVLNCGEVGWLICAIKDIFSMPVGDTLTLFNNPAKNRLPGFKTVKPRVYAGLFPVNADEYDLFRDSLCKLSLNDASLFYEPERSSILGLGFRCGFLGLLHMEIIQERLAREYTINLITTAPTVIYEIITTDKKTLYIDSPSKLPIKNNIKEFRIPIAECQIIFPKEYIGSIMNLCIEKHGVQINMIYKGNQVRLIYELPMSEIVLDFFDRIKSISRGYASIDYEFKRFQKFNMERVDILINGEYIDLLSMIVRRDDYLYKKSRALVDKLKELIPRQQFEISIQAVIGTNIIASSTVKPFRKNVIEKCYGGDVSRKKKLLKKQKEGKKRMKIVGNVEIPQEAFLAIMHVENKNKKKSVFKC